MKIVWDEPKRLANMASHGLDFADFTEGFFETSFVGPAKRGRFIAVSGLNNIILAVIFTPLGVEGISVVSMRVASRKERRLIDG